MAKRRKKRKNRGYINKLQLLVAVSIFITMLLWGSSDSIGRVFYDSVYFDQKIENIGLPTIEDSTYYVVNKRGRYSYLYSQKDKQAHWVAYMLTKSDLQNRRSKRENNFRSDDVVKQNGWQAPTKYDYYKSSYDRGHLLPSADRNRTKAENSETFLFSNITPQNPLFNRNTWSLLESQIRDWALKYDTLYVVTGGILGDRRLKSIGENKVTIPKRYFKVILSVKDNIYNSIGFVLPNSKKVKHCFITYQMSVDDVEDITDIDFFSNLPDSVQGALENNFNSGFWKQSVFGSIEKKKNLRRRDKK